jgi:hypothetical protein
MRLADHSRGYAICTDDARIIRCLFAGTRVSLTQGRNMESPILIGMPLNAQNDWTLASPIFHICSPKYPEVESLQLILRVTDDSRATTDTRAGNSCFLRASSAG